MKRIFDIQQRLDVAKTERQSSYMYRTLPATLKALLPLLKENGLVMTLPCESEQRSNGTYVVASCQIWDATTSEMICSTTYVTLDQNAMIKGGQGTGAAATYAKKGAIDGMFLLDANNPNALDLDDLDGLQRAADREEDETARAYEKRVKAAIAAITQATSIGELADIAEQYAEVRGDERVRKAGAFRQEKIMNN